MNFIYFLLIIWIPTLIADVHIIMTSALIDTDYERRKQEYIRGVTTIQSYGIEPWIIESMPITSSFFDALSNQVLYPQTNNPSLTNKGVKELMSIRACLPYLPFNDEDLIIKLTGRYWLYERTFIDTVQAGDYDAYVYFGKYFLMQHQIFTGCFALRWKYFKQFVQEADLEKAEKETIDFETMLPDFIRDHNLRMQIVDPLYVEARIFFDQIWMINFIRKW